MEKQESLNDMDTTTETNYFYPHCDLTIWLRNCHEEVRKSVEGNVTLGSIPHWLNGVFLQNGPGGTNTYGQNSDCETVAGSSNQKKSRNMSSSSAVATNCKHLFDGPGLLQKFEFSNGRVSYTNRFIQTKSHGRNGAAGRLVLSEFGTVSILDPCQTIFQRISAIFYNRIDETMTDTANISVHSFGDEIYSLAESPFAHRIELENLDTLYRVNLNAEIGIINHTSHPHIYKQGKKVYNIGQKLDLRTGPHYIILEMDTETKAGHENNSSLRDDDNDDSINVRNKSPWSQAKILASIPSRWLLNTCYMHSFSVTESYFVLIEQPLSIFIPEIPINYILGRNKPIASCLKYFPEQDTLFHLIPRNSPTNNKKFYKRRLFRSPAFFFLHTINAFERKTTATTRRTSCNNLTTESISDKSEEEQQEVVEIIVDICCYDDPKMIECMYVDALKNAHSNPDYAKMFRGRPKRFHLNLGKDDDAFVEEEILVDFGCETPQIYYDLYNGKDYTFFYAISSDVDLDHPGLLVKVNTKMKTWIVWGEPESKSYPSEPIFVPAPYSKDEDDGIVISSLLYGGELLTGPNKISVVLLDAKKWELVAMIEFHPGTSIPKCLHGMFLSSFSEDETRRLKIKEQHT